MIHDYGTLVLVGAYGRMATKQDWEQGKDFRILNGGGCTYCSIRDKARMKEQGFKMVRIINVSGRHADTSVVHEETL